MEIIIDAMTSQEVAYIARETANSNIGELYFDSDENKLREILTTLGDEEKVLVARIDDTIVGYVWYGLRGVFRIHPYIHMHFVRTDMRSRGIGKKLLHAFEEEAGRASNKIFLAVAEFNYKAARFYQNEGYKSVGCIPGLYREGLSENLYMKDL